jgi:hypothetical protein
MNVSLKQVQGEAIRLIAAKSSGQCKGNRANNSGKSGGFELEESTTVASLTAGAGRRGVCGAGNHEQDRVEAKK